MTTTPSNAVLASENRMQSRREIAGSAEADRVEDLDPLADSAWDDAVLAHPDATPFHSAAWARVLAQTYGHRPRYLRFTRAGQPRALVPLMEVRSRLTGSRGVCLPFSDCCEPLLFPGAEPKRVLDCLARMAGDRGWKYVEIRHHGAMPDPSGAPPPTYYAHELDLRGGRDAIESRFAASARRALRKAIASGLHVEISSSWDAVRAFTRLHAATRRRHGVPTQPAAFFRHLHEEMLAAGHGFVVLVSSETRPVAAALFLRFGPRAVYKFGASDSAAWDLRPNNLVIAEGIFALAHQGARSLHFGRTNLTQSGLRQFKRSWGARESALGYLKFEPKSQRWTLKEAERERNHLLFRLAPPAASRLAGRLIYPHLD